MALALGVGAMFLSKSFWFLSIGNQSKNLTYTRAYPVSLKSFKNE